MLGAAGSSKVRISEKITPHAKFAGSEVCKLGALAVYCRALHNYPKGSFKGTF